MAAWIVNRRWDPPAITRYRNFVQIVGLLREGGRATCEDFALNLLIDFAAANSLPLKMQGGLGSALQPTNFSDKETFSKFARQHMGASDVLKMCVPVEDSVKGDSSKLVRAQPGDLIIMYYEVFKHVQVVLSTNLDEVVIGQGNFRDDQCTGFKAIIHNKNDPDDSCYIGELVRAKSYLRDQKTGKWIYDGMDEGGPFADHQAQLMIWDFYSWNHIPVELPKPYRSWQAGFPLG